MARPQPIVIPASMTTNQTTAPNILEALQGLSILANLYQGTAGKAEDRATEAAGYKAIASQLGFDRKPANESPVIETSSNPVRVLGQTADMPAEDAPENTQFQNPNFLVNLPQPSGVDMDALSKSKLGQELIKKQYEQKTKPEELGAIETDKGIVTYGKHGAPAKMIYPVEKNAKPETPHTQIQFDKSSPTGNRYFLYNNETKAFDIPGAPAPKQSQMDTEQRNMLRFDTLVGRAQQDPTVAQYYKVQGISPRIERAYKDYKQTGNAAVLDDAVLYAINKMNDPDSVVMIGEYMRTKELQSVFHAAQGNLVKMWQDTGGLAPKFREEFVNAVRSALKDKEALYDQRMDYYRGRATKYNTDKQEIGDAFPKSSDKTRAVSQKEADGEQIAPVGTKAKLPSGKIVTSDGKGGWN